MKLNRTARFCYRRSDTESDSRSFKKQIQNHTKTSLYQSSLQVIWRATTSLHATQSSSEAKTIPAIP